MIKTYYRLTKPGIIYGNLLTATAGFLLAAKGDIDLWLFLAMAAGLASVIASACVFNNVIDRDIDAKMSRTKKRAVAAGSVSVQNALFYATGLGVLGFYLLFMHANPLSGLMALAGFLFYVLAYSFSKPHSVYATYIGSIAGAVPPVVGYSAASGQLDSAACLLFLLLVLWQMPHFFTIAIFRLKDYKNAAVPVWPAKMGLKSTKLQIMLFVFGFVVAVPLLSLLGYTGVTYLLVASALGLLWLWKAIRGFRASDDKRWAREMFSFSLVVLMGLSAAVGADYWLP